MCKPSTSSLPLLVSPHFLRPASSDRHIECTRPSDMESCSLRSATATATVVATSSRIGSTERKFLHGQVVKLPSSKRCAPIRRANKNNIEFRAGASGTTRMSTGATEAVPSKLALKDDGLAFVAGATGRVGSRTVRELLKLGYRVRAAVRSAEKAEALVQSVKQIKLEYGNTTEGLKSVEMLEIVECDLERPGQIGPALGNASVVICCIGASEKEVFDVTGPYRIDFQATKNLIDAATVAKVNQFILVSSLGTNKIGFPAAILNLFWGVLIWKRKAEEALIASGVPYTIVRPGGMERPTDAYKETHNITLSEEDTLFGGQVSNLQVAELMAVMAKNRDLAYCKVVEVIAETTAPLTPMEDLLARIPSQRPKLKELDASGGPPSAPSTVEKSVPSSTPVIEETSKSKAVTMRPLSPYPFYDDLKPPTSPTPTSPSSSKENSDTVTQINALGGQISIAVPSSGIDETTENGVAQKEKPLSPFAAYDESKPPSSPSLIPSAPQSVSSSISEVDEVVIPVAGVNDVVTESDKVIEKDLPEGPASYRSPYYVYEDLKPPTSPSPSSPSTQPLSFSSVNVSGNDAPKPSTENKLLDGEEKKKLRPLSPYSAYEDLKPPTSPTPFPKNF